MIDPRTRKLLDEVFAKYHICRCDRDDCTSCRRIAGKRVVVVVEDSDGNEVLRQEA